MRTRTKAGLGTAAVLALAVFAAPPGSEPAASEAPPASPLRIVAPTLAATPSPTAPPTATPEPTVEATPRPTVKPTPKPTPKPTAKPTKKPAADVYYANCAAVRAAGKDPLYRGDPGYRSGLDRDNDGVACE